MVRCCWGGANGFEFRGVCAVRALSAGVGTAVGFALGLFGYGDGDGVEHLDKCVDAGCAGCWGGVVGLFNVGN